MLQRWDFNDLEALRSFEDATLVANESTMVQFGRAYVLGPGTNRCAQPACSPLEMSAGLHSATHMGCISVAQAAAVPVCALLHHGHGSAVPVAVQGLHTGAP